MSNHLNRFLWRNKQIDFYNYCIIQNMYLFLCKTLQMVPPAIFLKNTREMLFCGNVKISFNVFMIMTVMVGLDGPCHKENFL